MWLSKEAQIDEISALRLVVLQWQQRHEDQLLGKFSEEEITSLQDAIGISKLSQTSYGHQASGILKYAAIQTAQSKIPVTKEIRQKRLFHTWLSEKKHILKFTNFLINISIRNSSPGYGEGPGKVVKEDSDKKKINQKLGEIGSKILGCQDGKFKKTAEGINTSGCIEAIRLRLKGLESGSGWFKSLEPEPMVEESWLLNSLEELVQIMQVLFIQLRLSDAIPSSQLLLSWLRLMAGYDFLELARPANEEQTALFSKLQALISITTLCFLKFRRSSSFLENPDTQLKPSENGPFFLSPNDVNDINDIFLKTAQAGRLTSSPAVFAWAILMYSVAEIALALKEDRELKQAQFAVDSFNNSTQSSSPSRFSEISIYEDVWEKARNPAFDDDFVRFLVSSAVDRCHLFDLIYTISDQLKVISGPSEGTLVGQLGQLELLDLIRSGVQYLDYIPELVSAVLCIISEPNPSSSYALDSQDHHAFDPRAVFLQDEVLMEKIFKNAKSRFPYEAINLLKICRALSGCNLEDEDGLPLISRELEFMETYTQVVAHGFQGYHPTREDENANYVSLVQPLIMNEVRQGNRPGQNSHELTLFHESSLLPAQTLGQVVSDSKPAVIMWHRQYNCITFLGKWLEQSINNRSGQNVPDEEVAIDIVGLLADLMESAHSIPGQKDSHSGARRILEMASDGLDRQGDIISVIFDIFERSLQNASEAAASNENLELTNVCLHFISALAKVLPGRVWPCLVRSSFLAVDGKGGMLAKIVFAVEASSGDFSFLLASVRLFEAAVDDAISHAAIRRTATNVTTTSHAAEYTAGVPLYAMRNCLLSFVRAMVEIFSNNTSWKHNNIQQQLRVNTSLATIFQKILYYVYGVEDITNIDAKLTGAFSSSAQYLLKMLRPQANDGLSFNPMLQIIIDGFQAHTSANTTILGLQWTRLVEATLDLSKTLIRAGWSSGSPMSALESQIFNASPILARLYVLDREYQLPVVTLLELLLSRASVDPEFEPPSLFGHLGAESSCRFFDALSKFDRPYELPDLSVTIWQFLSAIISKRQQWLAVFLLTGSFPREAIKETEDNKDLPCMKSKPFLQSALSLLSSIDTIPSEVAVAALTFVSKAQEHWPWVTPELRNQPKFFLKLTDYVANLKLRDFSPYEQCMKTKIAALVADICSVYLHCAKEARDWAFFKTLIPLVSWYSDNAVEVDGYNESLHVNLKRNFEMKYTECTLSDIKRTSLEQPAFGDNYFYDVTLGSKVFGYDFAWNGTRNQGFAEEIKRANLNLSLVEAQMVSLHDLRVAPNQTAFLICYL